MTTQFKFPSKVLLFLRKFYFIFENSAHSSAGTCQIGLKFFYACKCHANALDRRFGNNLNPLKCSLFSCFTSHNMLIRVNTILQYIFHRENYSFLTQIELKSIANCNFHNYFCPPPVNNKITLVPKRS